MKEIAYLTEDVQGMSDFYWHLLDVEPVVHSTNMAIFLTGKTKIFIHKSYQPEPSNLPPENHIAFEVDDVNQACTSLIAQGLSVYIPTQDYYWGCSAYLRDPDGHLVEITKGNPNE